MWFTKLLPLLVKYLMERLGYRVLNYTVGVGRASEIASPLAKTVNRFNSGGRFTKSK